MPSVIARGLTAKAIKPQIGTRLTILDLYYANFTALAEGGGNPYFQLGYKVGEENTAEPTVYTLDLDIITLAEISIGTPAVVDSYNDDFDIGGGVFVEYGVKEELTIIKIDKGYVYANASVQIVINSPFLALTQWNKVVIDGDEDQVRPWVGQYGISLTKVPTLSRHTKRDSI